MQPETHSPEATPEREADAVACISRRDFLRRAAVAACVLAVPAALTACGSSSSTDSSSSGTTTDSGSSTTTDSSSGGSTTDSSSGSSGTGSITIDSASCEGCGDCLQACKAGVIGFDQNTRKAYVANAGACTLCGECVGRCRRGAITLGG